MLYDEESYRLLYGGVLRCNITKSGNKSKGYVKVVRKILNESLHCYIKKNTILVYWR